MNKKIIFLSIISTYSVLCCRNSSNKDKANTTDTTQNTLVCNTNQTISSFGADPHKTNMYVIATAHQYTTSLSYEGVIYNNAGLVYQAFQKIHTLEGNSNPLTLFSEAIPVNYESKTPYLVNIIPGCVINLGYTVAYGVDPRKTIKQNDDNYIVDRFAQIFEEYFDAKILSDGSFTCRIKKDIPGSVVKWLRDDWYKRIILSHIDLEKKILSKSDQKCIVICGLKHAVRMCIFNKISWAINTIDESGGINKEREVDLIRNLIFSERYVCEQVLKLPCSP